MRIALDAMGGDNAPRATVQGALQAVHANADVDVVLVGDTVAIERELGAERRHERIHIHAAGEVIEMGEAPVQAVRRKPDSSLVQAMQLVKSGEADAVISAGNTGALMAAGLFLLGRMPGVERPALTAILPSVANWGVLLLDVGANLDPKPNHLHQYALMGSYYCEEVYGVTRPRVGLLNVGEEAGKGPPLVKETYDLLKDSSLNFVGNVEARELFQGKADVVVCDGFSGNVALKLTEGLARDLFGQFREVLMENFQTKLAAMLLKKGLYALKRRLDYQEYGGAPLLGLDHIVYKCHGASEAKAFENAVMVAASYTKNRSHSSIRDRLNKEES